MSDLLQYLCLPALTWYAISRRLVGSRRLPRLLRDRRRPCQDHQDAGPAEGYLRPVQVSVTDSLTPSTSEQCYQTSRCISDPCFRYRYKSSLGSDNRSEYLDAEERRLEVPLFHKRTSHTCLMDRLRAFHCNHGPHLRVLSTHTKLRAGSRS